MSVLTVELPSDVYERLSQTASQQGKPVEALVRDWLVHHVADETTNNEREQMRTALRTAGLLVNDAYAGAPSHPLTSAERAELAARVPPGRSLSEIIIEERGAGPTLPLDKE